MDKVYSKNETMTWFLGHSSGSVICVRKTDMAERECNCYPEAEKFYNESKEAEEKGQEQATARASEEDSQRP